MTEKATKKDPRRQEILREAREQLGAAEKGSIAGIQAVRLVAELEGYRNPATPPPLPTTIPKTKLLHVEHLLRAAQANRLAAEAKASFVAASRYLTLERELLQEYDKLRRQAEADKLASRDESRIIDDFVADFAQLPKRLRQRIREIVEASR